jgi:hypothetical protein
MPSETEFRATLDKIAEYARDSGSKIISENVEGIATFEDEHENVRTFDGHRCTEDDYVYVVAGSPESRFMGVLFFIDISGFIASGLDQEMIQPVLGDENDYSEEENKSVLAANKLLSDMDRSQKEATEAYLHLMISASSHRTNIRKLDEEDESSGLSTIVIEDRIFPYESNFGISDFHDAKQSVLNSGKRASQLVERTLYIDSDSTESDEEVELKTNFNW